MLSKRKSILAEKKGLLHKMQLNGKPAFKDLVGATREKIESIDLLPVLSPFWAYRVGLKP